MRRREFFSILGGAAVAWPLAAQAQQPDRTRRIAVLMPYGEGEISDSIRRAFEQALRDLSWINGRNIQIEYRLAGDDFGRLRSLAKEAVKLHPDESILHRSPPVGQVPEPSPQEDQRSRLRHNGIAPRVVPNYEAV